jgi:2-C-methyl-D-erythritol 4-phosphate cytidylyltransferase
MSQKVSVIIPAAGKGDRFGGGENKTFAKIDGRAVFLRTIEQFVNRDEVIQTILVVSPADTEPMKTKFGPNLAFMGVTLVEGGDRRVDSVAKGLARVAGEAEFVAVHDAARPCVTAAMIDAVFAEGFKSGAAILGAVVNATLKRVSKGAIEGTLSREGLYEAQTPQVFRRSVMDEVFANLPDDLDAITDDAQLFELAGHKVSVVASDHTNLKVTTKGDIALANAIIKARPAPKARSMGAFEEAQW